MHESDGNPHAEMSRPFLNGPAQGRSRTSATDRRVRSRMRHVAGAGTVAALILVACTPSSDTTHAPQAGSVTLDGSGGTSVTDGVTVPVYWTGTAAQSQVLFRESLLVEGAGTADPIETALSALTQGGPADSDYRSLWRPVTTIGTSLTGETITIDLPRSAVQRDLEPSQARLAVQQMTHTAVAAAHQSGLFDDGASPRVRILIDGATQQTVFGSYELPEFLTADDTVLARLSLDQPSREIQPGQVNFSGQFDNDFSDATITVSTIDGAASTQETTDAERSDEGLTVTSEAIDNAAEPRTETTFSTTSTLAAGRYRVELTATDVDGTTVTDDHVFTVGTADDDQVIAES